MQKADVASIPEQGWSESEIFVRMGEYRRGDSDWHSAKTWSLVYHLSDEHSAFLKKAYCEFFTENLLNPAAFESLRRMESEVIQMSKGLFHGDKDVVGTLTSGGTESIMLAVKSARDRAKKGRIGGVKRPEIIAPESAHVAFEKACHYLEIKYVPVPLGPDKKVDLAAMRAKINRNTILLVGSAPQYPHGVMDPIGEIAKLGLENGIPVHVDACIGGFFLPFLEQLGRKFEAFDFRVPGVTSISADLHKYGYAAKGSSVLLYKDMSYLRHQFFVSSIWPGGLFGSPSMPGTRPGGAVAASWAALNKIGQSGYRENVRRTMEVVDQLRKGIESIPALQLTAEPVMSLVSFTTRDSKVSIYAIADQLAAKGWLVDRQQRPASIHCTVTSNHAKILDQYLLDLRAATEAVTSNPNLAEQGDAAMYGMAAKIPMRGLVNTQILKVMEKLYSGSNKLELSMDECELDEASPSGSVGAGKQGWRKLLFWT